MMRRGSARHWRGARRRPRCARAKAGPPSKQASKHGYPLSLRSIKRHIGVEDFTRRLCEKMPKQYDEEQLGFDFTPPKNKPTLLLTVDELYDDMSAKRAVDAAEDHRIERKSSLIGAKGLAEYFSMW